MSKGHENNHGIFMPQLTSQIRPFSHSLSLLVYKSVVDYGVMVSMVVRGRLRSHHLREDN